MYQNQPLGRTFIDHEDNLSQINKAGLEGLYHSYHSGNFVLVVGGCIEKDEAIKFAEMYFGTFRRGNSQQLEIASPSPGAAVSICNKDVNQSKVQINLPSVSWANPNNIAYLLWAEILGVGPTSRLFLRLREKENLVYGAYVSPRAYFDTGYEAMGATTSEEHLIKAYQVMLDELEELPGDISDEEFQTAKNKVRAARIFSAENIGRRIDRMAAELVFTDRIRSDDDYINETDKITKDQVEKVAVEMAHADRRVVVVTPTLKESDFRL
jgi:predicted Zn-dependent peptidase